MDAIKKSTGKGFNKQKEEEFDKDVSLLIWHLDGIDIIQLNCFTI